MMASKENTHQLIEGCDKGDLSSVNDLIAQGGVDVNGQNDVGECPLFTAVLHGHHDLAKVLLQHGANANTRNGCLGQTALMVASEIGCAEICELLLEFGADADVEVQNIDGWSLLLQECNMGYKNIAKLHKAVENVQKYNSKSCYWTAIMIASKNGDYDVVKLILEKEPRKRDIKSALRLACENKHVKVARLLLEHLAAHNNHGWSAFIFACLYNCREVLETLLIEGTDVNFTDRCGLTALIIACTSGHYEIAKLLLDHGSYVNAQKWNGQTALMSASRGGHTSIIKLLLDHQAATDIQDDKGWSSLMIASDRGFTEIVRLLADHGANTRLCNKDGSSALTIATRAEHAEVVKQLTDHRANKEAWMVPECTQSPDKLESSSSPTMRRLRLATNDSGYYSPSPLTQSTCESSKYYTIP